MSLNPVRQMLVERLWRGHDPLRAISANLFQPDLQGWRSEHPYLIEAIELVKPYVIVEVGVWKGASTIYMANIAKNAGLAPVIIAVDTWLGSSEHWLYWFEEMSFLNSYPALYQKFLSNVVRAGVAESVVPMPMTSLAAAEILAYLGVKAEMVHLDAAHDYDSVTSDLRVWWDLLAPGGILIGDDYLMDNFPAVRKAFDDFFDARELGPVEHYQGKCRIIKRDQLQACPPSRADQPPPEQSPVWRGTVPLSSVQPTGTANLSRLADGVRLETSPLKWSFAAEARFNLPGIETRARLVKVALRVESGTLGAGWFDEATSQWIARDTVAAANDAVEVRLTIPAGTKGGKLVFDNWTPAGAASAAILDISFE